MKSNKNNIHEKHRERMRNKALEHGFESFENHELLEFLLFYCLPRVNTNPIAHNLLNEFDNLLGVVTADRKELANIKGFGDKATLFIEALCELYKRTICEERKSVRLNNKLVLKEYVISLFKYCRNEKLYAICLDKNMFHLGSVVISKDGKVSEASVDSADAVIKILTKKPKYVILAHNHTDDNMLISKDDGVLTISLYKKLIEYNIEICDHYIVSGEDVTSFDEQGVFNAVKSKALNNVKEISVPESRVSSSFYEFDPDFEKFK